MTNDEIIKYYVDNGLITKCVTQQFMRMCRNSPGDTWKIQFEDDLINDLVIVLYEYDNEKLNDAHNKNHMNALLTRIILNNIYSKTSLFYRKYLKFQRSTDDLIKYICQEERKEDELDEEE